MDKIEKIKRYIERTAIPHKLNHQYGCRMDELEAIVSESRHPYEMALLAVSYGKAKGYRAGKKAAELERDKANSEKRQRMTVADGPAAQIAAEGRGLKREKL